MREKYQFIVLEWIDDQPGFPRYGFATVKHAEELGLNVRWLEQRSSLEAAAAAVAALNQGDASRQDAG